MILKDVLILRMDNNSSRDNLQWSMDSKVTCAEICDVRIHDNLVGFANNFRTTDNMVICDLTLTDQENYGLEVYQSLKPCVFGKILEKSTDGVVEKILINRVQLELYNIDERIPKLSKATVVK